MTTPEATVNGRTVAFGDVPPHTTALDWIRDLGFTGAKEGCAEGECGACAIMVARPSTTGDDATEWVSINACLIPAASLDGHDVITAEGLGTPDDLHPVQREMAVRGGSQCGYCTPGFICSMAAEYYRAGRDDDAHPGAADELEHGANGFDLHAMSGNLCRCTGYRPIRDAAFALGRAGGRRSVRARRSEAAPVAPSDPGADNGAEYVRPADLAATPGADPRAARRDPGGRLDGLGRRGQHPRPPGAVRRRHRPGAGAARAARRRRCVHPRRGTHPDRAGAPARRCHPAAGRGVPAVRLTADPQRRDDGRQSRHRLPDRRLCAGAAGARRRARAGLGRRRAHGGPGRLLHRLPADGPPAGRADQGDPGPASAGTADRLPQDRQAAFRRHLQRRRGYALR